MPLPEYQRLLGSRFCTLTAITFSVVPSGLTSAKRQPSRRARLRRPDPPAAASAARATGVATSAPAAGTAAEAIRTDLRVTVTAAPPRQGPEVLTTDREQTDSDATP